MSLAVAEAPQFQQAVRENVYVVLGIAGPSGGGKTLSGMKIAQGITGRTKKFAVIDTETRRALHYAPSPGEKPDFESTFYFDHWELKAPFRPQAFVDAIRAAARAGYPATMVDSFSAEWEGEGGQLDWHEEILSTRVKRALTRQGENRQDWELRESYNQLAWVEPKMAHKAMVQQLLQMRTHLILCLRAEDKIEMKKNPQTQKMEIVPKQTLSGFKGWIPICEKRLPFELTASFILTPDKPGFPQPIKLNAKHRPFFPVDRPISEESGRQLAEWARGGAVVKDSPGDGQTKAPTINAPTGRTGEGPAQHRGSERVSAAEAPSGQPRSNEPLKVDDESAPGLFPTTKELKPETRAAAASGTAVPGLDVDDESQAIVKLIDEAKAQLERQPTDAQWTKLCKATTGTEVLDLADPAALSDLLTLVRQLVEKDPTAIAKARGILKPAETKPAESEA